MTSGSADAVIVRSLGDPEMRSSPDTTDKTFINNSSPWWARGTKKQALIYKWIGSLRIHLIILLLPLPTWHKKRNYLVFNFNKLLVNVWAIISLNEKLTKKYLKYLLKFILLVLCHNLLFIKFISVNWLLGKLLKVHYKQLVDKENVSFKGLMCNYYYTVGNM